MAKKSRGFIQRLLGRGWIDPEKTPPTPQSPPLRDNEVDTLQFDGKDVRTIWLKGEQWWVATDVCESIEIVDVWHAIKSLDDDEKGTAQIRTLGGDQQMAIVNEPGLYHLLGKSNKPKAKAFWRWVRHEVLPSIRQTGSYSVDQTPIRPWIKTRARKYGFSAPWQKKRQKIADGNKAADAQTFAIGGDAMACASRYNALYSGLFGKPAKGLKKMLGCRDKDSPLDQMADVALSQYDAANSLVAKKMKDGSLAVDDLATKAEMLAKAQRTVALDFLGPDYDFEPIENQKGHKILDAVKKQLTSP